MRRIAATALAASMMLSAPLAAAVRAPRQQNTASLSGTAKAANGQAMANTTVQLRNVSTGELAGKTTSNANGAFTFTGLAGGTFAVEVLSATGQIIGTSAAVSVATGAAVTGVAVSASAAAVGVAGGAAAAAGAAAAGGATAAGVSTALVVTLVAVGAGIAGGVAIATNSSPSR
jgi:hypothetical protein